MHTFIGLRIPIDISEKLFQTGKRLNGKIPLKTWTYLEDLHITLKFIGETSDDVIKLLVEKLSQINYDKIDIEITGIDTFGNPKTPRVVFFGTEFSKELNDLYKEIQLICKDIGMALDPKPFKPHITIAKKWGGDGEVFNQQIIDEINSEFNVISCEISEITLFGIYPREAPKYKTIYKKILG